MPAKAGIQIQIGAAEARNLSRTGFRLSPERQKAE
jgi:hypothetical protein